MKFKTIKGGTEEEALAKFPWLADASFEDAVIDISRHVLFWNDGVWEGGVWLDGVWLDGVWLDGVWLDGSWVNGSWLDGTWKGGLMWSNVGKHYERVTYEDGKFISVVKD